MTDHGHPRRGRGPAGGSRRRHGLHVPHTLAAVAAAALLLAGCGADGGEPAAPATGAGGTGDTAMVMGGEGGMSMGMRELATVTENGMEVTMAAADPVTFDVFEGTETVTHAPEQGDDVHFMALLAASDSGQRIPYASVQATITGPSGGRVYDERLWPMISSMMGTHYGANVNLTEPGTYTARVTVGTPQVARHADGYADRWTEPFTVEATFDWDGAATP